MKDMCSQLVEEYQDIDNKQSEDYGEEKEEDESSYQEGSGDEDEEGDNESGQINSASKKEKGLVKVSKTNFDCGADFLSFDDIVDKNMDKKNNIETEIQNRFE